MLATQRVGVHQVVRLDKARMLVVDNTHEIKFTPSEYPLVLRLLEGRPVSDRELVSLLFGEHADNDLWAREAVDRHLVHVRRKFKQHRLKVHVVRIPEFGYVLISSMQPASQPA